MRTLVGTLFLIAAITPVQAQHAHRSKEPAGKSAPELERQINGARKATERYQDHALAVANGYKLFGAEGPVMGEHWYHPDLAKKPLDLEHPGTLQYATVNGRRVLVGVAYNVYQRPGEPLPEGFAGSTDHWHVHDVPNLARTLVQDRPLLRRIVDRRAQRGQIGAGDNRSQLVMVHAWLWSENPDGMFAQQHLALPYLRAGLPAAWAAPGNADAAWGVALVRNGCTHELNRLDRLARLSAGQKQDLGRACTEAATSVRAALANATSADALNVSAARAWRKFARHRDGSLTDEQKRRLAAVTEPMHPSPH